MRLNVWLLLLNWDTETKRAYESSKETYRVFKKMLESGHPPDDWSQLLAEAPTLIKCL